jgi:archaemetzincin
MGNNPDVEMIRSSVEKFYHIKCRVKPELSLTTDILADSKTRYRAERILKKYNSDENLLILTDRDIASENAERHVKEWGVFGLGYRPGSTCVISTFRLKRNAPTGLFHQRLIKVCLHEIGHNLGLKHCSSGDHRCMMNDAKGTIKVVDAEQVYFLCERCRKVLGIAL